MSIIVDTTSALLTLSLPSKSRSSKLGFTIENSALSSSSDWKKLKFCNFYDLCPNNARLSLYCTKCYLQPLYIYLHNSGFSALIHSHFSRAYITVKVGSNALLDLETLWKRIMQHRLHFCNSPSSFFKTIFALSLTSLILDIGRVAFDFIRLYWQILYLFAEAAVRWKFGYCSVRTSLKIQLIITHEH